jgi:hypothetical protein
MDRATEFLTGKPGLDFCDECVREALGTTRANLTEKDLHTNAVSMGLRVDARLTSQIFTDWVQWCNSIAAIPCRV